MKLRVVYFAAVREALGRDGEDLELSSSAAATVGEAVSTLRARDGGRWAGLSSIPLRFAVNCEFAGEEAELQDGDELAVFPPVTGG